MNYENRIGKSTETDAKQAGKQGPARAGKTPAAQRQGRVQPMTPMADKQINDDPGLEHEADVMGARTLNTKNLNK